MSLLPLAADIVSNALSAGVNPADRKVKNADEAREAAKQFEAFFMTQMLEQMFKDIPVDGPFGGGYGEGVFRSFLLKEYAQVLTDAGGIGIADMVTRELLNLQEKIDGS